MHHQLHTEITIDAPTDVVWDVLTDLDRYSEWNPFVVRSEGRVALGETLVHRMQPRGGKAMTFRPTVTDLDPGRVFEWLGRLVIPGLFDGRHRFELHPTAAGGTRLVHTERFRGVLVRLLKKSLDTRTREGFESMNEALRERAEAMVSS